MDFSDRIEAYNVGIENELRFTVGKAETVLLELTSGFAEIFGSELVQNKVYNFSPYSTVSLFSWKGCTVKLSGIANNVHVATSSHIIIPVSIHACLEERRMVAESKNKYGPRSLVVGPMQSGKTSFCKLLLNYASRLGRQPVYVSLDVAHDPFSVPGVISIIPAKETFGVTGSLNQSHSMIFNFGCTHPLGNIRLYFLLIRNVGEMLKTRLKRAKCRIRHSGVIIDAFGYVRREGYRALTLAAYSFQIDLVFVMEDRELYKRLKHDMPRSVQVVYVPKAAGIVEKSSQLRDDIQANRVWEYFYGTNETSTNPYTLDVNFSDVEIYAAVPATAEMSDICSIGLDDITVVSISIGPELLNRILAVSFADKNDANMFVTNVRGFVCIVDLDMTKQELTLLSPQPGPLPSKILIMSDVKLRRYGVP